MSLQNKLNRSNADGVFETASSLYLLLFSVLFTSILFTPRGWALSTSNKAESSKVELSGTTKGYGNLRSDGFADFGLVLKGLNRENLFHIKLDDLMSTSTDTLRLVFGQTLDVPSNIALPEQSERYSFITVRLNKPEYRIYFNPEQNTSTITLHGRFPFSEVIDGFRNDESLLELASYFDILSYSLYEGAPLNQPGKISKNIQVGQSPLKESLQLNSPPTLPQDYKYIAVSLLQKKQGLQTHYFPLDVKVLGAGQSTLIKYERGNSSVFTGLFHSSFADQKSVRLEKFKRSLRLNDPAQSSSQLLGFVEHLAYQNESLSFQAPRISQNLQTLGLVQSGVRVRAYLSHDTSGRKLSEEILAYENFHIGTWGQQISMNGFNSVRQPQARYRIEVDLLGTTQNTNITDLNTLINTADFVSQNALQL